MMEFLLGYCLYALWQFIQNISGFMHPALLPSGITINLWKVFPESQGALPNANFGVALSRYASDQEATFVRIIRFL